MKIFPPLSRSPRCSDDRRKRKKKGEKIEPPKRRLPIHPTSSRLRVLYVLPCTLCSTEGPEEMHVSLIPETPVIKELNINLWKALSVNKVHAYCWFSKRTSYVQDESERKVRFCSA